MKFPSFARKSLKFFAFLIFVLSASLAIFELIARAGLYEPNVRMHGYTLVFDSERLFRIKPKCAPDINEMGYRGSSFKSKKPMHRKRVLFLGDSFVMGHNVSPGETIAAGLGKALLPGAEVFNMGVLAYGPDQSLVSLEEDGSRLEPDMVVLGLFPANDYQDIVRSELYSLDGGGRLTRNEHNIVTKNVPKIRTFFLLNHIQYLLQPKIDLHHRVFTRNHEVIVHHLFADFYDTELLFYPESNESKYSLDLMKAILDRFKELSRSVGAGFSVVIIPSYLNIVDENEFLDLTESQQHFDLMKAGKDGFFGPENLTARLCEELEIPYLSLYPEFMALPEEERAALYDPGDWHLSALGNRFAGELAASVLVRPELTQSSGSRIPKIRTQFPWL